MNSCYRISTHTPVRVWLFQSSFSFHRFFISTHTPVRVWPCDYWSWWLCVYFNSHTREGVTSLMTALFWKLSISTHTPVRVWLTRVLDFLQIIISTHTPVRVWLNSVNHKTVFFISTHTPVRVWRYVTGARLRAVIFQLTHPWGCDNPVKLIFWDFPKFQLTHPWGCDIN